MFNFSRAEQKILAFWKKNKVFEKLRKKNQGKKRWSFLDGPITANNPMGVHHAWGRTYKDLFQRYKAMQGFDERFHNGFDCQGLHVEVEVEKELGFKNKKDIEKYGIARFVEKCKERVKKYAKIQTEQSIRLGQWMDWDNSYYTMSDENNYAIWGFLKKCFEKGLLYKGRDVVPWCIRCGTAISQHEILTEEYQEITHKAVFVKLPIIGQHNTYFLVWTTTPWTLPANVALAVSPKLKYVEIKDKKGDIFIVLKSKADLIEDGKIIKEFLGEKLAGLKYKGMFDELPAVKEETRKGEHKVIFWKDVSEDEGTGIVHIAPGCGQEDFQLGKELKLSVVDPLTEESRYKKGFGFLEGKLATEAKDLVFENLKKKDFIFKIEDYKHRYPTCWRCKQELIFRLVDEWYIGMDKLRKPLREVAKKIKWIPPFGLERELDWLKNMQDWLISKKRYWGLALPIFECRCGNFEVIGSKEELKEKAVEGWDKFKGRSPHRPWVDAIKIKCSKCGELVSRIPDVGNPWLDAGIVPFSTMGYHKNKDYWQKWFPVDLVCESFPGQFKNWFYSIITMSTVLESVPPVRTIFGYALVRDEKGEEMHKSKGNAIWFDEAVEKIGADPMRWMYGRQNPVYNLNFGYKLADEVKRKLSTLNNSFAFFTTYVEKKDFPLKEREPLASNILDKWIVSRLNSLIEKVGKNLDKFNPSAAVLSIEDFFIEDLSLWYIRRSRKRIHFNVKGKDRKQAIETFYYVFLNLLKIIAPVMPFWSEQMYGILRAEKMPESIHLLDWPQANKKLINKKLEGQMEKARQIVTEVLAQRVGAGIKVRQPLASLKITNIEVQLAELIKEEVNVKKITFGKEIKLDTKLTQQLKKEGLARDLARHIQEMRKQAGLRAQDKIELKLSTKNAELKSTIKKLANFIKKETSAEKIADKLINADFEKEIKLKNQALKIGIRKVLK